MITLAIASLKGGVGKTTTAVNLAFSMGKRGWKTLLVDTDPQGSVGLSLSPMAQEHIGLYEIIHDSKPFDDVVLKTKLDSLKIIMAGQIPGSEISAWCANLYDGKVLGTFLQGLEDKFEVVIIDTPSGLHGPTEGVLRNSTHLLVPQQCEPLALRSLIQTVDFLDQLRVADKSNCLLIGVLLTMADGQSPESQAVIDEIHTLLPGELLFNSVLPRDAALLTASMKGMPVGLMGGDAPPSVSLIFDQLAAELGAKLELATPTKSDDYISLVV